MITSSAPKGLHKAHSGRKRWLSWTASISATASIASAQLAPDAALKSFQLADDLRVELVAAEPLVESPCALAFDEKGRLFVAENRGYPRTAEPPQGRIALLTDTDGDGRMDQRTTFAEGFAYPNGVLPWDGGVIVTAAPDVLFLKDTDGDGRADERRVLLTGFDTAKSTQLRVNKPMLGPDGWIVLAAGLSGGTITSPEHPEKPSLKMTGDVRWNPQTGDFEGVDGKSQFGQSFDDFGRRFICMNRLPVQHVVLASRWLARNPRLAFSETVQDCNERGVKTTMKGGGDGVRLFPTSRNITTADSHAGSFSAACAITIWRGGALPDRYDGAALSCDPTGNLVHADKLVPRGATFSAEPLLEKRELLSSSDDWCRPVFLASGPDGALYVADMYRNSIEHPDYMPEEVRKHADTESGKNMGRIWRIKAATPRPQPAPETFRDEFAPILKSATDPEGAAKLADDPSARVRFCTALVLGDLRSASATEALAKIAARDAEDRWTRAAVLSGIAGREADFLGAVWPRLQGGSEGELELLAGVGRSFADPAAALAAIESLSGDRPAEMAALLTDVRNAEKTPHFSKLIEAAVQSAPDPHTPQSVRLLFIRLLGRSTWERASAPLLQTVATASDDTLHTAAIRALTTLDASRAATELLDQGAWRHYSPTIREALIGALLARPANASAVLAAIDSGGLPASAFTAPRRLFFSKHPDAAIRDRAAKVFAATTTSPAATQAKVQAALALTAKSPHGREIFKQACVTCHRLNQEGANVGPDLFDMRRQPKENIAFHIISPDAEIAPAFTAYSCETKDGRGLAGILTSETPTSISIRQPGGTEETVLRADLKSLTALPTSLMPPGLDAAMSPQDFADLLAYLKGEQ